MATMETLIPATRGVRPSSMGFTNACFAETSDDLATKYAWLKSSDRDGAMGALSITNRRVLVLAPGTHTLTATLTLDACFVDICALIPENPEATVVTGSLAGSSVITQTALNVNLTGFTVIATNAAANSHGLNIAAVRSGTAVSDDTNPNYTLLTLAGISKGLSAGTYYNASCNDRIEITGGSGIATGWYKIYYLVDADSVYVLGDLGASVADVTFNLCTENNHYRYMTFKQDNAGANTKSCAFTHHVNGFFDHCAADNYAFSFITDVAIDYYFWAEMRFCSAGIYSFVGDRATMDCGTYKHCTGEDYCFASCNGAGSDSEALYEDCIGGDYCWSCGKTFAGTIRNCAGGLGCVAGYYGGGNYGTLTGLVQNCVFSGKSCGSGESNCKNSGTLINTRITAMPEPMFCEGARIEDCYLQVTGENKDCLDLNDGNTVVYNTTLIANGTGESITAGEAQNVLALHCRVNLDKHANITNLTGDGTLAAGYCIVDSDVS